MHASNYKLLFYMQLRIKKRYGVIHMVTQHVRFRTSRFMTHMFYYERNCALLTNDNYM